MAYLPKDKILIVADIYTPGAPMQATPPAAAVNLYDNIKGYKLDVQTSVGLHVRSGSWAEFLQFVQKPNERSHNEKRAGHGLARFICC